MERKELIAFVLIFLACIIVCLLLTGCRASTAATVEQEGQVQKQEPETISMFVEVERASSWKVVYHRETKVMYVVSNGAYNYGTFTMLAKADGSPLLWEG